jgi:hypothetical protein
MQIHEFGKKLGLPIPHFFTSGNLAGYTSALAERPSSTINLMSGEAQVAGFPACLLFSVVS